MYNKTTGHLSLPLPHEQNALEDDALRIIAAFRALDAFAKATDDARVRTDDLIAALLLRATATEQAQALLDAVQTEHGQTLLGHAAALAAKQDDVPPTAERRGSIRVGAGLHLEEGGNGEKDVLAVDPFPLAVPVGFIGAFSGSFGGEGNRYPIPLGSEKPDLGWCLCDGVLTNGLPVPDLRGRMILGSDDAHAAGSAGGAATHTHSVSGTVGATTLSAAQLASHTHTATGYSPTSDALDLRPGSILAFWDKSQTKRTVTTSSNGSSNSHTHGLTASSGAASSLPPYYSLAFIMRCA